MALMDRPPALHQPALDVLSGERVADLGLSQAEASQRAIRKADQTWLFAPSEAAFEVLQALQALVGLNSVSSEGNS